VNLRVAILLVPFAIAASCGGTSALVPDSGSDAGNDAPAPATCTSDSDCPSGGRCAYSDKGNCGNVMKQCFAPKSPCVTGVYCACDSRTMFDDCGDGTSKPVKSSGACPTGDTAPIYCELADVTGFSPVQLPKVASATQACSSTDISLFVAACESGTATQESCAAWKTANAGACESCIFTSSLGTTSGPFICDSQGCQPNSGGCVDIVSGELSLETANGGGGSCGEFVSNRDQCVIYACGGCIEGTKDYANCAKDTVTSACIAFQAAASCESDAGTSLCSPQSDTDWVAFIKLFCGTGP